MSAFSTSGTESGSLLDPQELAANQRGEITTAQRQRLNFTMTIYVQASIIPAMAGLVGAVIILLLAFPLGISNVFFLPLLVVVLGVLLWAGLGVRRYLQPWSTLRRDCDNSAIRQALGKLKSTPKGYIFQAGERSMFLPKPGMNGLLPDVTYRAYYLDESGFVLSVEEASPADL